MPAFLSKILPSKEVLHDADSTPSGDEVIVTAETVDKAHSGIPVEVITDAEQQNVPDLSAQDGVTKVEAITLTWSKASLGAAYFLFWALYLVRAFQGSLDANLSPYVTSDFAAHSLLPVIGVVASSMAAATFMPLTKILNIFDRATGFMIMIIFATIGLILSATCTTIETYAAAQVFYSIGFTGMIFSIDVITADTSTLRDRGLAYAFTSSPYIITAFAGPVAAQNFYDFNWRWGYGSFAIILPVVALPLFILFKWNLSKAKARGLLPPKQKSGRTIFESFWYYTLQFDILGTFLLAAGLVIFLLPFTIAADAPDGWNSGYIIAMLVVGLVCLVLFGLVERYVSPVPFVPWSILTSRTVVGACALAATYQISSYTWRDYFTSFLQVVFNTDITTAGYINSIFDVVSGVWLIAVGFLIKKTRRFRWLLYITVPLYILGIGLMIYFRRPQFGVGYTIMCQIFIAFAGGAMIIVQQVAALSAADHNNVAATLAVLNVAGSIGSAIGSAISGAVWTHTLPDALQRYLPDSINADWETIYDDLSVQLSYDYGTPERDGIIAAYAEAQQNMLIAGTAIMSLALIWMFLIRDIKLDKEVQTKGVLF